MKSITYQEIKEFIEGQEGNGCKLLMTEEEFEQAKKDQNKSGTRVNLKILCGQCKIEIFYTSFNTFENMKKRQCNNCGSKERKLKLTKSQQQFEKEIYNLVKDEYSILSKYKNNKTKIKFRHNNKECNNYEFDMKPESFLNGQRCPYCNGNQLKTTEQFIEEVKNAVENEYTVLGKYINAQTKILIRHNCNTCNNYKWEVKPSSFLMGTRCPMCSGNAKKNTNIFKKEVYDLVENEYTVLGEYINSKSKILIQHNCNKCNNHKFKIVANAFLNGQRCPQCNGTHQKTTEQFKKEVYDLVGEEYTVLSEYENNHTKILLRHNNTNCNNHEFKMSPNSFLSGQRCIKCNGNIKKTTNEFKQEVDKITQGEYSVLGEYINGNTKILMRHNSKECHNHKFPMRPGAFLSGCRCPKCNKSKGEIFIDKLLRNNNMYFTPQYEFNDLLSDKGNPLRIDFAIFNDEAKTDLKCLIEYDGEFHFKKYYEKQKFKTIQEHDKRKNEYCLKNNIKLIRIPYWEFDNIKDILDDILIKNNYNNQFIINNYKYNKRFIPFKILIKIIDI